jgi:hypothetical protein
MLTWNSIFTTRAKDWVFGYLESSQTPDGKPSEVITANTKYITVLLKSARIVNVRQGLSKFSGVVHCRTSLPVPGQTNPAEFHFVSIPNELQNADAKNLDRVVQVNKEVLGPIPYTGGTLEVEAGLFSVKTADLLKPYLDVISDLASLAGVSYVQVAKPFVAPIQKGLDLLLTGGGDQILEIGLSTGFNPIKTGYFIVLRLERNKSNIGELRITGDDFRIVGKDGESIQDAPYMVFEIKAEPVREDYYRIPEIRDAYKSFRTSLRSGKLTEAQDAFAVLRRITLTSYDLLPDHADEIVKKADDLLKKVFGPTTHSKSINANDVPTLEELPVSFRKK